MARARPLRFRELFKKLKKYNVQIIKGRGKGSEIVLLRPTEPGSNKGPTYPIKHHSDNDVLRVGTIDACLRRLGIPKEEFWK